MTSGGRRKGAGRPVGSTDPNAGIHRWFYRATDDEEARRIVADQTPTQRIRMALTLLAQKEDEE